MKLELIRDFAAMGSAKLLCEGLNLRHLFVLYFVTFNLHETGFTELVFFTESKLYRLSIASI